jgi:hypothetical protein
VIRPGKIFLTRVWVNAERGTTTPITRFPLRCERTSSGGANSWFYGIGHARWWSIREEVTPDYHSTSDAAGFGGASVLVPEFLQVKWEGELEYLAALHINVREMFMVATSGLTFGHRWSGKLVIFHCDNLSDVFAVLKGKSKNKEIMHLI